MYLFHKLVVSSFVSLHFVLVDYQKLFYWPIINSQPDITARQPSMPTQPNQQALAADEKNVKIISKQPQNRKSMANRRGAHACECGRSYANLRHLVYHKKWECGKELRCHICFKQFVYRSHLRSHINKFHTVVHMGVDVKTQNVAGS